MLVDESKLPESFVEFLNEELLSRNKKNSRYSLRAFAKQMQLSSSFVSKLLSGKRPLTQATFKTISLRLPLSPQVENYYFNLEFGQKDLYLAHSNNVDHENDSNEFNVKNTSNRGHSQSIYKNINLEQFKIISEWYHFAILELVSVDGFIPNSNYIASQLGISNLEAQQALHRLIKMGLIKLKLVRGKDPSYYSENFTTVNKKIATKATYIQQKAFLEKSIDAMEFTPIEDRSQSSMTMAIPKSRLKEAELLIRKFRREFTELMQRKGKRDSVYQLNISFFPLTQLNHKSILNTISSKTNTKEKKNGNKQ